MSPRRLLLPLVAATAALSVVAAARPADACSAPWGIYLADTVPSDAAEGVPTNAQVVLHYEVFTFEELGPIELRTAGGEDVAVDLECWYPTWRDVICRLAPTAELTADTTYEVYDQLALPCDSGFECTTDEPQLRLSFTTGSGRDDTPPVFAGVESVSESFSPEEPSDSCGPHSSVNFTLGWTPATDDSDASWIRYHVMHGDALAWPYHDRDLVSGAVLCTGEPDFWPFADFEGGPGRYRVAAIDVAGNLTAPAAEVTVSSCAALEPDAGPPMWCDSGPSAATPDAGTGQPEPTPGCGCRASSPPSSSWLALLALGALRRKRSRGRI